MWKQNPSRITVHWILVITRFRYRDASIKTIIPKKKWVVEWPIINRWGLWILLIWIWKMDENGTKWYKNWIMYERYWYDWEVCRVSYRFCIYILGACTQSVEMAILCVKKMVDISGIIFMSNFYLQNFHWSLVHGCAWWKPIEPWQIPFSYPMILVA